MLDRFAKVASVNDIEDGQMLEVQAADEEICLVRIGNEYYAISNICTHFYALLSGGCLYPDRREVQCPLHDSRFNLATGEPTGPPATKPVKTYAVKVEGSDIFVGPREDG